MNEQNVEYLANEMFYTGFGEIPREKLTKEIEAAVKNDKETFQIVHDTKYGKDSVRAMLNFKQSTQNPGMFFYNSFDLLLKKEGRDETLQQNFSANYGNRFTLKEGYNLLDGRSVNKNFIKFDKEDRDNKQEYNAWVTLDFKDTDKYGNFLTVKTFNYDLEKKVGEYPIKGLEYQQNKNQLMDSLKKGNRVPVQIITSNGEQKMHIEAAARFNSLNFFDESMKPIRLSVRDVNEGQAMENGQAVDQAVTQEGPEKEAGKKNKQAESITGDNGQDNNVEKKTAKRRVKV